MPRTKGCAAGKKKKRKPGMLRKLDIDEVSFVSAGMNQNAHMSLLKTADAGEFLKRAFADIFEEYQISNEKSQAIEELVMTDRAFRDSVYEVFWSDADDKKSMLLENLNQFVQTFASMVNQSDVIKSAADLGSWLVDTNQPQQEVEDVKKNLAYFVALSTMTDVQKGIFQAMDEKDQEALIKSATSEDGKEVDAEVISKGIVIPEEDVNKGGDDDEMIVVNETTVKKSDVDPKTFAIMKGLQDEVELSKKQTQAANDIAKSERDLRITKELADEAEARWPNLPGTPMEKGKMLKGINAMDDDAKDAALKGLDSGNAGNADLFKNAGHGATFVDGTPEDKLNKMAKEHADKNQGMTFAKAYTEVLDTTEGKALYEQTIQ